MLINTLSIIFPNIIPQSVIKIPCVTILTAYMEGDNETILIIFWGSTYRGFYSTAAVFKIMLWLHQLHVRLVLTMNKNKARKRPMDESF